MQRFKISQVLGLASSVTLVLLSQLAFADTLSTTGSILQDLQQKTLPSELRPEIYREKPAESQVQEAPKVPVKQAPESEKTIFIQKIEVQGVTFLDEQAVRQLVATYENKDQTFASLQELTEKLTKLYQAEGYVTSRIYIPVQKLENNTLILKALEGRVGKITVQPGKHYKARSVAPYVALESGDPFNVNKLKRSLRFLNETPDRNVRAVLNPGAETGQTDLELVITDQNPIHLSPSWDNLGRQTIGDRRMGLRFSHNNLLGFGDSLMSSLSFTRRSFGVVNHYEIPVGRRGTRLMFDQADSKLQLGESFASANITGHSSTYSPGVSQVLLDRERYKLTADVSLDFKQMDTNQDGVDLNHDLVRILRPGLTLEEFDRFGRTYFRNEVGIGLPLFGGSGGFDGLPSRTGAGSKFVRVTSSLIRTQRMPWSTYAIFRLLGQYSPDRLVSAEQFQSGGAFTVRGYREGLISGDSGMLFSAEWRAPFFLAPKNWKVPFTHQRIRDNVQMIGFIDYGNAYINRPTTGTDRFEQILGAGVGLRMTLTRYLTGRIDFAWPLLNQPDTGPRVHFGLESALF